VRRQAAFDAAQSSAAASDAASQQADADDTAEWTGPVDWKGDPRRSLLPGTSQNRELVCCGHRVYDVAVRNIFNT
jgi:hypothetical protein